MAPGSLTADSPWQRYTLQQNKFVSWMDVAEIQLEELEALRFNITDLKVQDEELKEWKGYVSMQFKEYIQTIAKGRVVMDSVNIDKANVEEDLHIIKTRWKNLNKLIEARGNAICELMLNLGIFEYTMHDLTRNIITMGSRLREISKSSHDATLATLQIADDTPYLDNQLENLKGQGTQLIKDGKYIGPDTNRIRDELDVMCFKLDKLKKHFKEVRYEIQEFQCETCLKRFDRKCNLNTHLKTMHGEFKEFQCETCLKRFREKGNLNSHLKTAHGGGFFKDLWFYHTQYILHPVMQTKKETRYLQRQHENDLIFQVIGIIKILCA